LAEANGNENRIIAIQLMAEYMAEHGKLKPTAMKIASLPFLLWGGIYG
jgi:hypothetical protein